MRNLIAALPEQDVKTRGTIIWDRGNMSARNIRDAETAGWYLVSGIPRSVKRIRAILSRTEIRQRPDSHVRKANTAHIYGKLRNMAVYVNPLKALNDSDERNSELAGIAGKLDRLSDECMEWDEAAIHSEIYRITGEWKQYFQVKIKRKCEKRIEWRLPHTCRSGSRETGRKVRHAVHRSIPHDRRNRQHVSGEGFC